MLFDIAPNNKLNAWESSEKLERSLKLHFRGNAKLLFNIIKRLRMDFKASYFHGSNFTSLIRHFSEVSLAPNVCFMTDSIVILFK